VHAGKHSKGQCSTTPVANLPAGWLLLLLLLPGVEYGVVRATFQQQLQQMLLTVLALWIPLLPLLFLAQRMVDSRNGTRRAKSSSNNAPRVTFADVAGEHSYIAAASHHSWGQRMYQQCCVTLACMLCAYSCPGLLTPLQTCQGKDLGQVLLCGACMHVGLAAALSC
jgi:hypothetical protein